MAHLSTSETLHTLDILYSSLFGDDNMHKWRQLKQALDFDSEQDFVSWLLRTADKILQLDEEMPEEEEEELVAEETEQSYPEAGAVLESDSISAQPILVKQYRPEVYEGESVTSDIHNMLLKPAAAGNMFGDVQQVEDEDPPVAAPINYCIKQEYSEAAEEEMENDATVQNGIQESVGSWRSPHDKELLAASAHVAPSGMPDHNGNIEPVLLPVRGTSKQYTCSVCSQQFSLSANLKRHHRIVHLQMKPYHCHLCGRRFSCKHNMENHVKRKH